MSKTQIVPKKPKIKGFDMPIWHHSHSNKLSVVYSSFPHTQVLTLKSNAVTITIQPNPLNQSDWLVEYEVIHFADLFWNKGRVVLTNDELTTAFGLSDNCEGESGQLIVDNYGGDAAIEGSYIRYGKFLNIPGPGTGHDGDANVSIYLTDEIKEAIKAELVKQG